MRFAVLRRAERWLVLAVIVLSLFAGLGRVPFHPDESLWIGYSNRFELFFSGRFGDPAWQEKSERFRNGAMTYYVVGLARRLGGWTPDRLNLLYRFRDSRAVNRAAGRIPEPGLLWWARAGTTTAAALGVWGAFLLALRAGGRPLAYGWLALVLTLPALRLHLRGAMNEGPLLALVVLAAVVLHGLLRAGATGDHRWRLAGWTALAGIVCGLAAQTKLNGGAAVLGVLAGAALLAVRRGGSVTGGVVRVGLAAGILVAASFAAFVAPKPTLWGQPFTGTAKVVRARMWTMQFQARHYPKAVLHSAWDRLGAFARHVFGRPLPLRLAALALFLTGSALAAREVARWARGHSDNHALCALTLTGAAVSAPVLFAPLDWPRYFVLPQFFCALAAVAGALWLARRFAAADGLRLRRGAA